MKHQYTTEAETFTSAIKALASDESALFHLECYLSVHFETWLKQYAGTPEGIASELNSFTGTDEREA